MVESETPACQLVLTGVWAADSLVARRFAPPASAVRKEAHRVVVVVASQTKLLQIVRATHPVGGLANLLHGWQQQANQDRDDRDYDETTRLE